MELRKVLSRKSVKLLTLLLTSMFIATVSAQVYYSLTMTSTVGVFGTDVYFVVGADNGTAGLNVAIGSNGTTATLTGLRAYPNATFTYTDPVRVRNNGSTVNVRLAPVSRSGAATNFVFVNFTLMGTSELSLDYTSDGSTWTDPSGPTGWISMPSADPDTEWSIKVETKAQPGAVSDTVTIEMTVDVE